MNHEPGSHDSNPSLSSNDPSSPCASSGLILSDESAQDSSSGLSSLLDDSAADLAISSACNMLSFVTANCMPEFIDVFSVLTPPQVGVLTDLVSMGAEIERLPFYQELPHSTFTRELGQAIHDNRTVLSLVLASTDQGLGRTPRLARMFRSAAGPQLERLKFAGIEFHQSETRALAEALGRCSGLRRLKIFYSAIDADSAHLLARGIAAIRSLEEISFSHVAIDSGPASEITEGLRNHHSLRKVHIELDQTDYSPLLRLPLKQLHTLTFRVYPTQESGIISLLSAFLSHDRCALESLDLSDKNMGPAEGSKLVQLVLRAPHLRAIDISENPRIGAKAGGPLGNAIQRSCIGSLWSLNVDNCGLGPGLAAMLGQMRGPAVGLTSLDVSGNSIGDAGAKAISVFILERARSLTDLNLSVNKISVDGANSLAGALKKAVSIASLRFDLNEFGPSGAVGVLDALTSQSGTRPMRMISLLGCEIGGKGTEAVARLIRKRGCQEVRLTANTLTANEIRVVVDAIADNNDVTMDLNIAGNPIGCDGAKLVAERLILENRVVRRLDMRDIGLGDAGAKAIVDAMRGRKAGGPLRELQVEKDDCEEEGLEMMHDLELEGSGFHVSA